MEKKMTQKMQFMNIIDFANEYGREDIVKFCEERIEVLDRRSANKTMTKTQKENEVLMETIVEVLTSLAKPSTISEIQAADERLQFDAEGKPITNQKMSALLKQLVDTDKVVKVIEKRKAYFSIAD